MEWSVFAGVVEVTFRGLALGAGTGLILAFLYHYANDWRRRRSTENEEESDDEWHERTWTSVRDSEIGTEWEGATLSFGQTDSGQIYAAGDGGGAGGTGSFNTTTTEQPFNTANWETSDPITFDRSIASEELVQELWEENRGMGTLFRDEVEGLDELNSGLPRDTFEKIIANYNMDVWYYDKLTELADAEYAARTAAGEINEHRGETALSIEIVKRASEEIESRMEHGEAPTDAFNAATSNFPRELRGRLAAYEFANENIYGDFDYREELETFAGSMSYLTDDGEVDWPEPNPNESTELIFESNPFDDPDLSEDEAELVLHIRLSGYDESPLDFDRVEDTELFTWWLERVEDVQVALDYHAFGQGRTSLFTNFLPYHEWEDLDPNRLEFTYCENCGDDMAYGETPSGQEYVSSGGELGGVEVGIGNEFIRARNRGSGHLCSGCVEELRDADEVLRRIHYIPGTGEECRLVHYGDFLRDVGFKQNTPWVSVGDLDDEQAEQFRDVIASVSSSNWYSVGPGEDVDTQILRERLSRTQLLNIDNGIPVMFEWDPYSVVHARFPADSPPSARLAKNFMEGEPLNEMEVHA